MSYTKGPNEIAMDYQRRLESEDRLASAELAVSNPKPTVGTFHAWDLVTRFSSDPTYESQNVTVKVAEGAIVVTNQGDGVVEIFPHTAIKYASFIPDEEQ